MDAVYSARHWKKMRNYMRNILFTFTSPSFDLVVIEQGIYIDCTKYNNNKKHYIFELSIHKLDEIKRNEEKNQAKIEKKKTKSRSRRIARLYVHE